MGQLFPTLSYLTGLALIGVISNSFLATAQNCIFHTDNIDNTTHKELWIITGDPISEKTSPGENIWDKNTANVKSSIASQYPHARYLSGHRYPSRYAYRATDSFPDFVQNEKSIEIQRNVTYTCDDGGSIKVHFKFPLIDENEPPEFDQVPGPSQELSISLKEAEARPETIINLDIPITLVDKDFSDNNNNVTFMTDRKELLVIETQELEVELGKKYNVQLKLNLTNGKPALGRYTLNLFGTDGQFTKSIDLVINVLN